MHCTLVENWKTHWSLRLIQTAAVSCGKCRRLQKTHASDAAVCGKIEKILISKKKFAVSCGRLNEPIGTCRQQCPNRGKWCFSQSHFYLVLGIYQKSSLFFSQLTTHHIIRPKGKFLPELKTLIIKMPTYWDGNILDTDIWVYLRRVPTCVHQKITSTRKYSLTL